MVKFPSTPQPKTQRSSTSNYFPADSRDLDHTLRTTVPVESVQLIFTSLVMGRMKCPYHGESHLFCLLKETILLFQVIFVREKNGRCLIICLPYVCTYIPWPWWNLITIWKKLFSLAKKDEEKCILPQI